MARLFVTSINLNKNELQNARIQNLSSAPSSPVAGQVYYNTSDNIMYFYNGSTWISTSGSLEVIQDAIGQYVLGGTALTATYDDTAGTTTIDLDNTTVTAGSYGSSTAVPTFTVDAQGRLTAASTENIATALSIAADTGTADTVSLLTDTLTFTGGEGIDTAVTNNTITIAAEDATSSNKGIASFNATDFTVTTGAVTLNAERVEDIVGNLVVGGTGIDATYTDGAGTLSIDIDSTVTTNSGTQTLTNKTLGSGTALSANLNAGTNKITNLGTPTDGTDAATKAYVDAVSEGLHIHEAAKVYVGTNITIATDLEAGDIIDGVTLAAGMRVLVNGQTTQSQNGVYVVAVSGGPTRALDFDTPNEVKSGDFIFVSSGTSYGNTGWVQTLSPATIGSDAISFTQFSGAGTYLAGAGLTLTGSTFSVDVTPTSGSASLTNTGGAVEVKVNTTDGLEVSGSGLGINNGTGLTFSAGALVLDTANGYGVRKLAFSVGDGSATSYTVNHALATRDVTVQLFDNASPYAQVEADVEHTDSNNLTIKFATAPTSDQYRVVVVG
jgi:hypothetical protein